MCVDIVGLLFCLCFVFDSCCVLVKIVGLCFVLSLWKTLNVLRGINKIYIKKDLIVTYMLFEIIEELDHKESQ